MKTSLIGFSGLGLIRVWGADRKDSEFKTPLRTFFGPDLVHHDNTLLMQMSEGRLFKKPADMSFHQLAPGTQGCETLR